MQLSLNVILSSLLATIALSAHAEAGAASSTPPGAGVDGSLASIHFAQPIDGQSAYAPQSPSVDLSMPLRVIDVPPLKPLPVVDVPGIRSRDRANDPAVEPVPAPNALALGMVMLATIGGVRIIRRLKLA